MITEVFMDKYSKLKPALLAVSVLVVCAVLFVVGIGAGTGEINSRSAAAGRSLAKEKSVFGKVFIAQFRAVSYKEEWLLKSPGLI